MKLGTFISIFIWNGILFGFGMAYVSSIFKFAFFFVFSQLKYLFNLIYMFFVQRVNITKFGNCDQIHLYKDNEHFVRLKSITYDYVDGYCDTIHGSYVIPTVNKADKMVE